VTGLIARLERLPVVSSTNDVVRDWLADGVPEVCLAVADLQLAGRGRAGRRWTAPAGTSLLLSVGTRPAWIAPDRAWQIAATVSLAIAEAAEDVAGLPAEEIRLKWPNDLVVAADGSGDRRAPGRAASGAGGPAGAALAKLGGVLTESTGLGGDEPRLVVGLGLNVDWEARHFPTELAASMTSLRVLAGRPVSRDDLLAAFLERLEPRLDALRRVGRFALDDWAARQLLPGAAVRLEGSGDADGEWLVLAVDGASGELVVADPAAPGGERRIRAGEAVHVRRAVGPEPGRPAFAAVGRA
jgi:BirA family biotin operon repressor/biotin-[acetyl-CoA-carboxylase] ligase